MDETAEADVAEQYRQLCEKRAQHIPLQHLTGQAYFMGYEFYVDDRVLVPRQDTETLVEEAVSYLRELPAPKILDMCTGSGCILLSLLMELPQASGTGADVSADALEVAKENTRRLGLEKRAELIQSDLISNPPYIRTADIDGLMDEVRLHDPRLALDGKADGLYFYEKITEQAGKHLKPGGWLIYEIGCDQAKDVAEIMKKKGFVQIEVKKDLAGLDRIVEGRMLTQEEPNV